MWVVFVLFLTLAIYGIWEYRSHQFHLSRLPIRIHVNGSRGKSSVTRLITGGLRRGGYKVFAKTTGTKPRMLFVNGNEVPVRRIGKPNIIEQIRIVGRAAEQKPDFFVAECMGIQPHLQELLERHFIRSNVGVVTNVRPDHLDIMGPSLYEVAHSLSTTIPRKGHLFTSEKKYYDIFNDRAAILNTAIHQADDNSISDSEMRGFSYLEQKENVALALSVCQHFGVSREDAFQGMYEIEPDPGVVRRYHLVIHEKSIEFVNAFAANDPESFLKIWDLLKIHHEPGKTLIVLVNSRRDRIQRAEQLGEFIATELDADYFVIAGEYTKPLVAKAVASGLPHNRIEDLGGRSQEVIFNTLVNLVSEKALIFGIGNIVGFGEQIVDYFKSRGRELV
ncbi:MAG: poly-gamma-glutamate synthase PgsB [Candidatus Zixiibacteriota bacterium]|nr:MAG: poly-gamma-glutamate synthase PgsB [candidate division Zixibacteria bacterium]